MAFEILSSKTIYSGRVFKLRTDRVALPDGGTADLDIVEHGGAVVIIPRMDDGRLAMIRQYRHAARTRLLEFPAGTVEPGEDPLACAQRELREETGFSARTLERIGGFFLAPGYSTEYLHIFYATGLEEAPLEKDSDEYLDVEPVSPDELSAAAAGGGLEDAKSLAALFLAAGRIFGG